ncbi:Transcription initiation factor IIA subunit 2 [Zea mays]|uniref:Transcription initiation factor IIA subunit 2 n=1 Tax=Zea mays TaxID=4577 RepID=A0A3L6DQE9_MAIZE|nr:Transcription initiation factor IIA subunit 2 [Zea mays]
MATFELYRRSTIGMCLTETLDEMVSNGTLSPELAIQVLVQFDKSMTDALENQVKSKVTVKVWLSPALPLLCFGFMRVGNRFRFSRCGKNGHLHTYRFCDNVWTFILTDASFKNEEATEQVGKVKIVACDSKLLGQ